MTAGELDNLRQAGRVAAAARTLGARRIVAGARLREVCEEVEDEIQRLGGALAFPVQSSRNHVAAHYCPGPDDASVYSDGDLAKLDVGVHIDGHVVDTALTVSVGDRPENRPILAAAQAALAAGISAAGPGVPVRTLTVAIERAIRAHGLRPMRNLCGHGVARWTVHCPPPIPNSLEAGANGTALAPDLTIAIEPFATPGAGHVTEAGPAQVFRLDPRRDAIAAGDPQVLAAIRSFRGLPFARRQLAGLPRTSVESTLAGLLAEKLLTAYAPLVEAGGQTVAQAEHTLLVTRDGVEVLTA
jgi:methionyl aminopeptidase